MASWHPNYVEELARVERERADFADGCTGVNQRRRSMEAVLDLDWDQARFEAHGEAEKEGFEPSMKVLDHGGPDGDITEALLARTQQAKADA